MSLFEQPGYQWRETYFVLFDESKRPSADQLEKALAAMNPRFEFRDVRSNDEAQFESLTLLAPDDFAAMDISCVAGEEVREQIPALLDELRPNLESSEDEDRLKQLAGYSAHMDIFHFEQQDFGGSDEGEMEFMDPGGLLLVLERLGELSGGVVIDPQSSSMM